AVTKADLDGEQAEEHAAALAAHVGHPVRIVSAVEGAGTDALMAELMDLVRVEREKAALLPPEEIPVLRPEPRERFTIEPASEEGRFRVEGRRVVSFVEMMDTNMEGSADEVHRRLERWGVAKALRRAGAIAGDPVEFGESI